mmetsp:Transcript_136775/g.354731  ORF Transcript_136775/g.354731 Transcript_136775/m.354731 type:complete len:277 (+) Transcript_136775:893-1723(+)
MRLLRSALQDDNFGSIWPQPRDAAPLGVPVLLRNEDRCPQPDGSCSHYGNAATRRGRCDLRAKVLCHPFLGLLPELLKLCCGGRRGCLCHLGRLLGELRSLCQRRLVSDSATSAPQERIKVRCGTTPWTLRGAGSISRPYRLGHRLGCLFLEPLQCPGQEGLQILPRAPTLPCSGAVLLPGLARGLRFLFLPDAQSPLSCCHRVQFFLFLGFSKRLLLLTVAAVFGPCNTNIGGIWPCAPNKRGFLNRCRCCLHMRSETPTFLRIGFTRQSRREAR